MVEKIIDCVEAVRNLLFAIWFIEWTLKENAKDFVNSDNGCSNGSNHSNSLEYSYYRFWKPRLYALTVIYGIGGLIGIISRLLG